MAGRKNPHSLIDLRRALENNPHSVIDLRRALDKSSQFDRLAARSPMLNREPVLAGALGVLRYLWSSALEGAQQAVLPSSTFDGRAANRTAVFDF